MSSQEKLLSPRIKISPNGPEVSQLVIGNWRWGEITKEQQIKVIDKCLELGITTIDTADIYGGYTCEAMLGEILEPKFKADPTLRSKLQIITKTSICLVNEKIGHKVHHYNSSEEHILASVTRSLENMKIDYIDILLLHRADFLMNPDEVARAFNILHKSGKVLYFGVSNYSPSQFDLLQSRLDFPLVTNQVELSPVYMKPIEDGTLDQCTKLRICPMAWSIVRGVLIEQVRVNTGIIPDQQRERINKELTAVGEEMGGLAPDQVAYLWVMTHPSNPLPVLGTSKPERIQAAVEATKYKRLTREHWYRIWIAAKGHAVP